MDRNDGARHLDASDDRIEVTCNIDENGEEQVLVQHMSFGQGIGWYAQKTLRLEPSEIRALMRALSLHRRPGNGRSEAKRSRRPAGGATSQESTAEILRFPTVDS